MTRPALLLLRPLGGSVLLWGGFRERLEEHFEIVAPETPVAWSVRAMARRAVDELDARGIERAAVYGQSLGGMVALDVAALAPSRVERLVLASTARAGTAFMRLRAIAFAPCLLGRGRDIEPCLARRVLSSAFRAASPERVAEIEALLRRRPTPRYALAGQALAGATYRISSCDLERIRCPVLVLLGARDDLLGHAPQRELARSLPHARVEIVAESGHDLTLERPEGTARAVLAFAR